MQTTRNGHGAPKPATTVMKAIPATSRKRPNCDRARTSTHRPMSAYQPTHLLAAARPIRTPTSGSTHQALRAQRPDQICQKNA